ncbi:NnrS family protein [Aliiroseovarius sediminis]|uniref:NnrS family protein n=1 Tax=Aliiroseovarius sediminis TaxID=2925839 RepID=UPI001F58B6AC|nr:NnrS family protein [Aliiroseovarius sediminis]MCI2395483.1 NnrS family protein [Aliiroseovarius sediminis]
MILLSGAYRLFFSFAALFAGTAIPIWLIYYAGVVDRMNDPLLWHQHEMLWGYTPAVIAGFLFTAIPNWTRRPPLGPVTVAGLFGLWLTARIAMFAAPEGALSHTVALAFLPIVALLVLRELLASRNRRNYIVAVVVLGLGLSQAVFLMGDADLGLTMGFALIFVLMMHIGGRITPAFSRNWLKKRNVEDLPAAFGTVDRAAITLGVAAAASWIIIGAHAITGLIAAAAAVALALRLSRWRGFAVTSEPLLFAQHAGYAWLPVSMALLAAASLSDWVNIGQVHHAIGAGAIGTITVIVMLRALLGHSGRPIEGTRFDRVFLNFLHIGAVLRVTADWTGDPTHFYHLGGTFWAVGMVCFFIRAFPIALAPRV